MVRRNIAENESISPPIPALLSRCSQLPVRLVGYVSGMDQLWMFFLESWSTSHFIPQNGSNFDKKEDPKITHRVRLDLWFDFKMQGDKKFNVFPTWFEWIINFSEFSPFWSTPPGTCGVSTGSKTEGQETMDRDGSLWFLVCRVVVTSCGWRNVESHLSVLVDVFVELWSRANEAWIAIVSLMILRDCGA